MKPWLDRAPRKIGSCYSFALALAVERLVAALSDPPNRQVGVPRPVSDPAVLGFSVGFYGSLGGGMSVGEAVDLSRAQMMLDGGEQKTPGLKSWPCVNPARVTFA
jgi:hypothetical protein